MTQTSIRAFQNADLISVLDLAGLAYGEESPAIRGLIEDLASEEVQPPIRSFVVVLDDRVLGFIAFSPLIFSPGQAMSAYLLAPLAIDPEHQGTGLGRGLVETGIEQLRGEGVGVVLVYGDPGYYGRFGFSREVAKGFIPPYQLSQPEGWLGLALNPYDRPATAVVFDCHPALQKPELW